MTAIKTVRRVNFPGRINVSGALSLTRSGADYNFELDPLQALPYDVGTAIPYAAGTICNPAPLATVVENGPFLYVFTGTDGYVTPATFDPSQWMLIGLPAAAVALNALSVEAYLLGLPTSDPLILGALWWNGGVLCRSDGP